MAQDQANGDVQMPVEDSLEFRLLKEYTLKRRPADSHLILETNTLSAQRAKHKPKKTHKKNRFSLLQCFKPKTDDDFPERKPAVLDWSEEKSRSKEVKADEVEHLVSELTEISDSVHFPPCEYDTDGDPQSEDDVVQQLVELLRAQGDELDEKIKANKALCEILQSSFQYGFFSKLMSAFSNRVTAELPPTPETEKVVVALICEATSQLSGTHYHPMNRVLGFGAKYLQEKYSSWISRNMHVGNGDVVDESNEEVQ